MKFLSTIILALICIQIQAQNAQITGSSSQLKIKWIHLDKIEYAALLLPVGLENDSNIYYMQLDFGSPKTIFYNEDNASHKFRLGNSIVELDSVIVRDEFQGNDSTLIGTIGMDLIESSSIEMNFQDHYVIFNEDISNEATHQFHYYQQKILIPVVIGGESRIVMYDSGSSAFDFITDSTTWRDLKSKDAEERILLLNSWGKNVKVHLTSTETIISIGGTLMNINQIAFVEGMDGNNVEQIKKSGMQGMIGNGIFIGMTLYFDFKNTQFGVSSDN